MIFNHSKTLSIVCKRLFPGLNRNKDSSGMTGKTSYKREVIYASEYKNWYFLFIHSSHYCNFIVCGMLSICST